MRIAKEQVDVQLDIPGAVIRQQKDFGSASGFNAISGEYFSLSAGVDTTPLFEGLEGNLCQCPHWGHVIKGRPRIVYADREEVLQAGDLFYLPPGHTPLVKEDTEFVEFSRPEEYQPVMDHVQRVMAAASTT